MYRARVCCCFLPRHSLIAEKLTPEQRIEILRGMSSEYAIAKTLLPKSKKPLRVQNTGEYDKDEWQRDSRKLGPAARVGDLVQVTKGRDR